MENDTHNRYKIYWIAANLVLAEAVDVGYVNIDSDALPPDTKVWYVEPSTLPRWVAVALKSDRFPEKFDFRPDQTGGPFSFSEEVWNEIRAAWKQLKTKRPDARH